MLWPEQWFLSKKIDLPSFSSDTNFLVLTDKVLMIEQEGFYMRTAKILNIKKT